MFLYGIQLVDLFFSAQQITTLHMGPEGTRNRKKTPIFFVDAKRSEIGQEFQKHKS